MRRKLRSLVRNALPQFILQIGTLWLVSVIAQALATRLPVPVPPGAIGMAMLYALLCTGALPLHWIERGASLLVRHLGLFLTPYAVSIIAFGDFLLTSGLALAAALIGSTVIGMAATGWAAQASAQTQAERTGSIGRTKQ